MINSIKGSLGILFKWGLLAIVIFIVFRLVTVALPSLSQDNIKDNLSNTSNSAEDNQAPKKDLKTSLQDFFTPNFNNTATTTHTGTNNFEYKAIQVPTINQYRNTNKNNIYDYKSTYYTGNNTSYNNEENSWSQIGTDWNTQQTNWGEGQTNWNEKQTNWNAGQTDWSQKQNIWR